MPSPGQKWTEIPEAVAEEIKQYLLREGGIGDQQVRGTAETWRVRVSDATITYYKSGTLITRG